MTNPSYSNEVDFYELPQGYTLHRAANDEFINAWVIYRNYNEDFAQNFNDQRQELAGVPFCFWIIQNEHRVGGVVLLPNNIGDFFLIPPFPDASDVLQAVMHLLFAWSLPSKPIRAQGISQQYLQSFQQMGFQLQESRHWMIRPTAVSPTTWPAQYTVRPLHPTDTDLIAHLLLDAFKGGIGQYGTRDLEAHQGTVSRFFETFDADTPCGQASLLISDKQTQETAGVCMVNLHKGLPTIQFTAVSPTHRRNSLATIMLTHAISTLAPAYDWVKLAVTIGNPAELVYQKMGFMAGDTLHTLINAVPE
ncbi:MAG: GNAT family N-acetyltransferase [Chloroflexi bacterium]|nr:GNAT family N-acetyltransferase [Chloroflexota bacterium]